MPTVSPQIAELEHAYQLLDIPLTASTRNIKKLIIASSSGGTLICIRPEAPRKLKQRT